MEKHYDVVVVGAGPAGLTAAIYASRSGVSVAVVENLTAGGVMAATPVIENYPGFTSISGCELAEKMSNQAAACGAQIIYGKAVTIEDGECKKVTLSGGDVLSCAALVLALGSTPRKLGVAREDELLGSGLSYCATCDGNFFRGKTVVVAGKGKHAQEATQYLNPIVKEVFCIDPSVTPVTELIGSPLSAIKVSDGTGEREIKCDGLFVELGYEPAVGLIEGLIKTDDAGYVICDERKATDRAGIFAAGDVVKKPLKQIATAVSDGAIAGQFAAIYVKKQK